ncbi:hypothetical protein ACWDG1_32275 [Streptomyces sp. NPDC001177]
MTHPNARAWLAGCTVAASVFVLASCTSGDGDAHPSHTPSSSTPSSPGTPSGSTEKGLGEQAQAALAAVQSGKLVESGTERVTDGIHTEPNLTAGKTYKLNLVCFGHGAAQLKFTPTSVGTQTKVPCDQAVVQQRITAHKQIHIDVDAAKGSTGVIAWEIEAIAQG